MTAGSWATAPSAQRRAALSANRQPPTTTTGKLPGNRLCSIKKKRTAATTADQPTSCAITAKGKKRKYRLASRFKGNNARRPPFFLRVLA
jgi:hypothetical protein